MATTYRAEHVGSLLRPPEVLEARAAQAEGRMGHGSQGVGLAPCCPSR